MSSCDIPELQIKQLKGYLILTAKKASLNTSWFNRAGKAISKSIDEAKQKILYKIGVVNEKMEKSTHAEENLSKSLNDCNLSFTKLDEQIKALQKINGDASYFIDERKKLESNLELVRNYFDNTTKPNYVILESANLIVEIDELTKSLEKHEDDVEKATAYCLHIKKQALDLCSETTKSFEKKIREEEDRYESAKLNFVEKRENIRNNSKKLKIQIQHNYEKLNLKKDSMQKHINAVISQTHESTMKAFESVPKDITTLKDEMKELYDAVSPLIKGSLELTSFGFIWETETSANVIYDELCNDGVQVILKWEKQYEQLKSQNITLRKH